jgi:hypothetical protein
MAHSGSSHISPRSQSWHAISGPKRSAALTRNHSKDASTSNSPTPSYWPHPNPLPTPTLATPIRTSAAMLSLPQRAKSTTPRDTATHSPNTDTRQHGSLQYPANRPPTAAKDAKLAERGSSSYKCGTTWCIVLFEWAAVSVRIAAVPRLAYYQWGPDRLITSVSSRLSPLVTRALPSITARSPWFLCVIFVVFVAFCS